MSNKKQVPLEDMDPDTLDGLEDDVGLDGSPAKLLELSGNDNPNRERRPNVRREIERRNELRALNSELDEWDALDDKDDW